jgi:hypothetical protein
MTEASSLTKMEIVGHLAARHGFSRYLELCTATTGNRYDRLDRTVLTTAHRLIYNCPADFDDGFGVDFRAEGFDIDSCLSEIRIRGQRYDIILVDPFHDYACSLRDLGAALMLVEPGGFLVVHDCLPANRAMAAPEYATGEWCGVTYKAYLDLVSRRRLDYRTVDTDYGCGVVRKPAPRDIVAGAGPSAPRDHGLWQEWHATGNDFDRAFDFLQAHKETLLRLVGVEAFLSG